MKHDQALLNRVWCQVLLEELCRFGVQQVCVAPGSRSTPLTLEADANPKLHLHTHFDERGLGYLALGLAKASGRPVAIIVTSGTAVANLLPAVAEAGLTSEKLVLLTADRPVELVDCGANQAIRQVGIFASHVCAELDLPSPNTSIGLPWLLTSVDQVMHRQAVAGHAVHINCPFPEPLYSDGEKALYAEYLAPIASWLRSEQVYSAQSLHLHNTLPIGEAWWQKKGLVVIGSLPLADAQAALAFAKQLGWPVLCDVQSGVTSEWAGYDLWLQTPKASAQLAQTELVVQFGSRLVSKRWNQWLPTQISSQCTYWYVSPQLERNNSAHLPQRHFVASAQQWQCQALSEWQGHSPHAGWADELKWYSQQSQWVAEKIAKQPISELSLACQLGQWATSTTLFLGNSLFVRLADMVARLDGRAVFTNRGASGIDGLFATAAGVQRAQQQPLLMILGDTSALYDLNSLALFAHNPLPAVLVVVNNDGGAIFDLLPVPAQQRQSLYQMPHGFGFEFAARQFALAYAQPQNLTQCGQMIEQHLASGQGTLLVEVKTAPLDASNDVKALCRAVAEL
ncbi:2-succinyl-5-enolpyruvyl-6-hydroxy-3-cyclohexene-1-carboxylic-acid synthase [Vibrio navarrensis]|uniref:2-succinyl-5-enolpyruvyl-6-hydroxy-3- cyclohexene-1-carboxylic-acid synthase n=1 Tax=Vibrio navarrensis TaxID=29495 RepID=UPI00186A789C|nr:2-succinyl-5-enolpyruvyl-6-hydroxy-3-cyclohexene-1-carboxylic-acid synthase [Vibrio navarrensis]MBE4577342.1 2-succinyl-5-enolpyruvyl-6-hydroxy-3-cyclohexene-1-carboxylic-acid synthase [Vibrio navarrensis]MBE4596253.1 2-succinyl-5-enolpyruvyl-6-hydroxy-3-cyclohexene-1-carboxylic-acid synthase [Vibrio navarrensis]